MENAPVIYLNGVNPPYDKDIRERNEKWSEEVYYPLQLRTGKMRGIDRYEPSEEKPDYPKSIIVNSFESLKSYEEWRNAPEVIAISKDVETTWPKYGRERIWGTIYQQLLHFNGNVANFLRDDKAEGEVAPFLNITAFNFSAIEWDKFNGWFGEFGPQAFLPLFSRLPGLSQCHCYKWTGIVIPTARLKEYPMFLMLFYFTNTISSQYLDICPEMAAFKGAIKIAFPSGFSSQWDAKYQLIKSYRK